MRMIFACIVLFSMVGSIHAQQMTMEFTPAYDKYFPYINVYTPSEGLAQFYLEDGRWVRNTSIPKFEDMDQFEDIGMQYITADQVNSPQLFVYSKSTGDFSFYFLTDQGWLHNKNIPTGKINMGSRRITAEYSPPESTKRGYIFSYATDGSMVEFLEITGGGWNRIEAMPSSLGGN